MHNEIRFRCSSLGYLMTEPRSKSELISETTKTHLVDVFASHFYKRREEIDGKYLTKGNEREEDSITLLSLATGEFYKKNCERFTNDYITGEPDIIFPRWLETKSVKTFDTKTSWSLHTFLRAKHKALDNNYKWQGVGYMDLTGGDEHSIAYCLVNGTAKAIMDEKKSLLWKLNVIDPENDPTYIERCKQVEINHIFNLEEFMEENKWFELHNNKADWSFDIPKEQRIFMQTFQRNEDEIQKMHERVKVCKDWMKTELYRHVLQSN
jgi:hypothetical protein